jgi:hypothetical protein
MNFGGNGSSIAQPPKKQSFDLFGGGQDDPFANIGAAGSSKLAGSNQSPE